MPLRDTLNNADMNETPRPPANSPNRNRVSGKLVLLIVGVSSLGVAAWVYKTADDTAKRRRADVMKANSGVQNEATPASGTNPDAAPQPAPAATPGPSSATPPPAGSPDAVRTAAKIEEIRAAAALYVQRNEPARAEAILKEGVSQFPEAGALRIAYAELLLSQRKLDEAYAQYEAALATGTRDAKTEFAAGSVANMLGKPERAVEHYSAAQTTDPVNPDYPLYLGQVQAKLGQLDEAKVSLLRSAKLEPTRAVAWGTLADIAVRENKPEIALQYIARARELEPGVSVWRIIEARALNRAGTPAKSLEVLAGLDESDSRQPAVARLIAETYGLLGEKEKASEWTAKADAVGAN